MFLASLPTIMARSDINQSPQVHAVEFNVLPQQNQTKCQSPAILELSEEQWDGLLHSLNQPKLRAKQIRHWLVEKGAESFASMTDLPLALRNHLCESLQVYCTSIVQHLQAQDDTHKFLLGLRDGRMIECVLIQEANRRTACISTQVGCAMGCVFCASGLNGVERNLTYAEILEQLLRLRNLPAPNQTTEIQRLTHIVVMGMGEPLANLDTLMQVLEVATSKRGLGLSARHVTISTVGLPQRIRKLADLGKQYHLAVSLHAPNDELRSKIVPTNDKTGIAAILDAADYFFATTGRQVTYEYVLLGGLNDEHNHARELTTLLRGRQAHVNLIPFNSVEGLPYLRPTEQALNVFINVLRNAGVSVKVRKRKGSEIDAACGQLRRKVEMEHSAGLSN